MTSKKKKKDRKKIRDLEEDLLDIDELLKEITLQIDDKLLDKQDLQVRDDLLDDLKRKKLELIQLEKEQKELKKQLHLSSKNSELLIKLTEMEQKIISKQARFKDYKEIFRLIDKLDDDYFDFIVVNLTHDLSFKDDLKQKIDYIPILDLKEEANLLLEDNIDRKKHIERLRTWLGKAINMLDLYEVYRVFSALITGVLHIRKNRDGYDNYKKGDISQAKKCYQEALELKPKSNFSRKNIELMDVVSKLEEESGIIKDELTNIDNNLAEISEKEDKGEPIDELAKDDFLKDEEWYKQKLAEKDKDLVMKDKQIEYSNEKIKLLVWFDEINQEDFFTKPHPGDIIEIKEMIDELKDDYYELAYERINANTTDKEKLMEEIENIELTNLQNEIKYIFDVNSMEVNYAVIKNWVKQAVKHITTYEIFCVMKLIITGIQNKTEKPDKIRILFISANPLDKRKLAFDEEIHAIEEELKQAKLRDKFEFKLKLAVRAKELQGLFKKFTPNIVHFSGHGNSASELILLDDSRRSHSVPVTALTNLFEMFKDTIRCVIFNACHSKEQAEAISLHIDYVVGMSDTIKSSAAIAFSQGFYLSLGDGEQEENAFASAKIQMGIMATSDEEVPQLITRKNI